MSRLVIYHTSDIHSRLGFGRRLAEIAGAEPTSLLVDCGDALRGSSVLYVAAEPVADEMRRAPYAAIAVGNREFHYLHTAFGARARLLPAPLVCSNLLDLWKRPAVFARELTVHRGGLCIRILGLLVPQYRTGSGWERIFGWRFLAPERALQEWAPAASGSPDGRPVPADATIVLSHVGLQADREVAHSAGWLTAILGGHSHVALSEPEVINGVPIAHPGAYAQYVGRLELAIENGSSRVVGYDLLPLGAAPERPAALRKRAELRPGHATP
jgi:2',3'-cyclic-nucleotide 2'-phosphodiesterase (5'-nucleotidase family)